MSNPQSYKQKEVRAQCLVCRDNKILMTKMDIYWESVTAYYLPGGGVEAGETPAEAAIRELKEECCVDGKIIRDMTIEDTSHTTSGYNARHTFLMDIGDQEPSLGSDPDYTGKPVLVDLQWMTLSELPERDRAHLFAAGILGIQQFRDEVRSWNNCISYPEDIDE